MIVSRSDARSLGVPPDEAVLRFGDAVKADGTGAGQRSLLVEDAAAFELSYWCGTCQFLFKRLEGANRTISLDDARDRLSSDIGEIPDDVIELFSALLEAGEYLPLLLSVEPRLVLPASDNDYYSNEQITTWGLEAFWGLPVYPSTSYYRTFETAVDEEAHLYEFVVPMVPPPWNERDRVEQYKSAMTDGLVPTAVALSILDICAPATDTQSTDYYTHWGLSHFLLDGHHKFQAAAELGSPVQLLALVALDQCLAERADLARIAEIRDRAPRPRKH